MVKAKLSANGMINFPASIRKKLDLKTGDELSFIETDEGILIVPVKSILDAPNKSEYEVAVNLVKELHKERSEEIW